MITIGGITLDKDMTWEDEFTWSPLQVKSEYSITGHVVVQAWKRRTFRPLTLKGDQNHGWQQKTTVQALYALAHAAGDDLGPVAHTVEVQGQTFQAIFDNSEGAPVDFTPVTWEPDTPTDFWYTGTIRMRILT